MKIILASKSPRRIEMMNELGFEFECVPSQADENVSDFKSNEDLVMKLAKKKAEAVMKDHKGDLVLGFDTLVFLGSERLGKPKDKDDCIRMMKELSGRTHEVITGAYISDGVFTKSFASKCLVEFYEIDDQDILDYAEMDEPYDKAGAYGIQGYAGRFIKKLNGDYFSVVGMPKAEVYKILKEYFREER